MTHYDDWLRDSMAASVPAWAKPKPFPVMAGQMTRRARPNAGRKTVADRPEIRAQIVAMSKAGETQEAISAQFRICAKTVRAILKAEAAA